MLSTIRAFRRLGDDAALARYLTWLDRNGHSSDLDTGSLLGMGLPDVANKRAEDLVAQNLKKLKRDANPNIHYPVNEICQELWFFLQTGQKETGRTAVAARPGELPSWPASAVDSPRPAS